MTCSFADHCTCKHLAPVPSKKFRILIFFVHPLKQCFLASTMTAKLLQNDPRKNAAVLVNPFKSTTSASRLLLFCRPLHPHNICRSKHTILEYRKKRHPRNNTTIKTPPNNSVTPQKQKSHRESKSQYDRKPRDHSVG